MSSFQMLSVGKMKKKPLKTHKIKKRQKVRQSVKNASFAKTVLFYSTSNQIDNKIYSLMKNSILTFQTFSVYALFFHTSSGVRL